MLASLPKQEVVMFDPNTNPDLEVRDPEPDYASVICPFCNDVPPDCDCPDLDGFVEVLARPITGGIWL